MGGGTRRPHAAHQPPGLAVGPAGQPPGLCAGDRPHPGLHRLAGLRRQSPGRQPCPAGSVQLRAALHRPAQAPYDPEHRGWRSGGCDPAAGGGCSGQRRPRLVCLVAVQSGDGLDTGPLLVSGPAAARGLPLRRHPDAAGGAGCGAHRPRNRPLQLGHGWPQPPGNPGGAQRRLAVWLARAALQRPPAAAERSSQPVS